jgi:hypothetical protein
VASYSVETTRETVDAKVAAILLRDHGIAVATNMQAPYVPPLEEIEVEALEHAKRMNETLLSLTPRQLETFKRSDSAKTLCALLLTTKPRP